MTQLLLCLLASYGLCFAVMNDKIPWATNVLSKLSFFEKMFQCPLCTGFHCGWLVWLVHRLTVQEPFSLKDAGLVFLYALASAAFCYMADTATRRLEQ